MFYNCENCSQEVKLQLDSIVKLCRVYLSDGLTGVYLHGSLAMNCFNPDRSDLDILVVVQGRISPDKKMAIIKELMKISLAPSPVEISFLIKDRLQVENKAIPYDLHYSESWRKRYVEKITQPLDLIWRAESLMDVDLCAHIRVINERGITLLGEDKDLAFPRICDEDYFTSILCDFHDAVEGYAEKPEYYILNSCRVLGFLESKEVMSKKEGGQWAINRVPEDFKDIIELALKVYAGKISGVEFEQETVKGFITYVDKQLKRDK
jgi:predicted nucleotidyltransferase